MLENEISRKLDKETKIFKNECIDRYKIMPGDLMII